MKKEYIQPAIDVEAIELEQGILHGSGVKFSDGYEEFGDDAGSSYDIR